jgi:hypothetical protein
MAGLNKVEIIKLYQSGLSLPEISEATSKGISTIRYHLLKAGVLRSRADGVRQAAKNGRLGSGMRGRVRNFTDEHKENIKIGRLAWGKKNARGFSVKTTGYCVVTVGKNKGRMVHDVIMEAILGRELTSSEVVHHKDINPSNNDPKNLKVMDAKDHMRLHRNLDMDKRQRNEKGQFKTKKEVALCRA